MTARSVWLPALLAATLALTGSCTPAPVSYTKGPDISANVSDGKVGAVRLLSWNASTAALMAGTLPSPTQPVDAYLTLPGHATGRVPAAIILHGISGNIGSHYKDTAEWLNKMGMAALVIDSYATRDVHSPAEAFVKSPYSFRVADAYAGLKLLSTHPAVDPNRIVLLGYSAGGAVTLLAMSSQARMATVGGSGPRFAGFAAYYPHCAYQYRNPENPGVPVLMMLGGADNLTLPPICQDYAVRLQAQGADVKVVVYPGAYHAFDVSSFAGKIVSYPALPNLSKCGDRVLQIEPSGAWYATWLNREEQADSAFGNPNAGCASGAATFGGPPEARTQSLAELHAFLSGVVGIK